MGIEVSIPSKHARLAEKLQDPAKLARVEKEFQKGGSYYNYLLKKIEAKNACSDPLIRDSLYHQEKCVELQLKVIQMKLDANVKTEGFAEYIAELGE